MLAQQLTGGCLIRLWRALILYDVAEGVVGFFAASSVERKQGSARAESEKDLVAIHSRSSGQLLDGRAPAQFLRQFAHNLAQPVEHVVHMDGHANRPRLVGQSPGDRL